VLTLLFAVIFLVSGLGGDVGVQWVDRWQFRLFDALVGGIAWCRRQVARLLGREPEKVAPAWYGAALCPGWTNLARMPRSSLSATTM
jgi:hypothetical protein